jgi:hypothetical protein
MTTQDLKYQDDWARGWMFHFRRLSVEYAASLIDQQCENTDAVVDGWRAREEAVKLAKGNEVKQ